MELVQPAHWEQRFDLFHGRGIRQFAEHRIKSPTSEELARLTHTIGKRIGRFLERQGLLERDAENSLLPHSGNQPRSAPIFV